MKLEKPILFSNAVEVADGFHFYYNTDDSKLKLDIAEVFDVEDSTKSESKHNFIVRQLKDGVTETVEVATAKVEAIKAGGTVRKTCRKTYRNWL